MKYSPANGTEFELFLENNCYKCSTFNDDMLYDRDDISDTQCNILCKILDQQGLDEKDYPDIYEFKDDELDISKGYPAECLKRKEMGG